MPRILNLETATSICSVCISQGEQILALSEAPKPNEHAGIITLLIDECLKVSKLAMKELDAVAVSAGPGSYTSLRVGVSTAKGICYALDKPLISVDTLQALALATYREHGHEDALICPMIDARRMEVYTALYNSKGDILNEVAALVIAPDSFQNYFIAKQPIVFSGDGSMKCKEALASVYALYSPIVCSAAHLPILSNKAFSEKRFEDVAYFSPNYLKAPNVTKPQKELFQNPVYPRD